MVRCRGINVCWRMETTSSVPSRVGRGDDAHPAARGLIAPVFSLTTRELTCSSKDYSYRSRSRCPQLGPSSSLKLQGFFGALCPPWLPTSLPFLSGTHRHFCEGGFTSGCVHRPSPPVPRDRCRTGCAGPVLWCKAASAVSAPRWWDDDDVFPECAEPAAPVARGHEPGNLVPILTHLYGGGSRRGECEQLCRGHRPQS